MQRRGWENTVCAGLRREGKGEIILLSAATEWGVTGVYRGDDVKLLLEMYSGKCT